MRLAISLVAIVVRLAAQDPPCDVAAIDKFVAQEKLSMQRAPQRKFEAPLTGRWHEVARWTEEAADRAIVYSASGRAPFVAYLEFWSETGDWTQDAFYYFRADGTLAKRYDELNTFHGEITAVRHTWFDCQGKELRSERQFYLLHTRTKRQPGSQFDDRPLPTMLRVSDLPFFQALSRVALR